MFNILFTILKKKGIKDASELTPEERVDFDRWKKILTEEVTVDTIKEFCKYQITIMESRFASGENTEKQDNFIKASLNIYLNLVKLIESPQIEKENLERYLNELIK